MQWSIPIIKFLCNLRTSFDLECSSPAFNRVVSYKNAVQESLVPLAFLQCACLSNAGLEHSCSDLAFKLPRILSHIDHSQSYTVSWYTWLLVNSSQIGLNPFSFNLKFGFLLVGRQGRRLTAPSKTFSSPKIFKNRNLIERTTEK